MGYDFSEVEQGGVTNTFFDSDTRIRTKQYINKEVEIVDDYNLEHLVSYCDSDKKIVARTSIWSQNKVETLEYNGVTYSYILMCFRYKSNPSGKLSPSDVPNLVIKENGIKSNVELTNILNAPSTDGTYTLKVTVTSGVPAYSWVSDSASGLKNYEEEVNPDGTVDV